MIVHLLMVHCRIFYFNVSRYQDWFIAIDYPLLYYLTIGVKINNLIINMFHSVPGVPREKMERFAAVNIQTCASLRLNSETLFQFSSRVIAHSERRLFTGFISAAFMAWKLTVANAITSDIMPAMANTHHWMLIRYW
jgi:hypothetical protein